MNTRGGVQKLVISQNRPTGWIGFASKAQQAMKGFFSLIITPDCAVLYFTVLHIIPDYIVLALPLLSLRLVLVQEQVCYKEGMDE